MELDKEQRAAAEGVVAKATSEGLATLGGYAGTGKTTVLAHLHRTLRGWRFVAFTGKAASNLRKKGVQASTIHSAIYRPVGDPPTGWELKDPDEVEGVRGFAVDEGSMLGGSLLADLASYGRPVLVVGDHGQLPPVDDTAGLMESPDFRLEKIHRNAGPIAEFAQWLREGNPASGWRGDGETVRVIGKRDLRVGHALDVDQVVVPFNQGRRQFNDQIRKALGLGGEVEVGDRIIVLRNNRMLGVYNGQQGTVVDLVDGKMVLDSGHSFRYTFDGGGTYGGSVPVDYAYCVTCHKAQGDEFDRVLVLEGPRVDHLWPHERWTYTAASRAKASLTWALPT